MGRIVSRQHPLVRRCREVAARRDAGDLVLLDGGHLVLDALAAGVGIEVLLVTDAAGQAARRARDAGSAVHEVSADVMRAASPVRTPSGVVALARWSPGSMDRVFDGDAPIVIGLVDVQDPGNAGSVIRCADALAAAGVLALGASADPGGWKALRGAMGSTFRVPVARGEVDAAIALARARGRVIAAATPRGGIRLGAEAFTRPMLLLLGNEGGGLPARYLGGVDLAITVPMRAGVESLNLAVTAALVLWESTRAARGPLPR